MTSEPATNDTVKDKGARGLVALVDGPSFDIRVKIDCG
jgi:hypothetical protein